MRCNKKVTAFNIICNFGLLIYLQIDLPKKN